MSKYDVQAIRNKLKNTMSGKYSDPDEFKPEKANSSTDPLKYRFFIMPPLLKGDVLKSGEVKKSMEQFFISHANHWINDKPYPCPRVWDGSDCKVCQFGFDLLKEEANQKDEDKRRKIIRQWMPTTYHMVNIFFLNWKGNPEELRGKVKFFNASKTLFDQWTTTLMRDDCGDPEDPQAFGIFFDENAAFTYELQVLKQGRQNSYKTSKFLSNGGEPVPMIKAKPGESNEEVLAKLLRSRHNLWEKIHAPDIEKLERVFSVMTHGDDDGDDNGGFDQDETANNKITESRSAPAAKPQQKTTKAPIKEDAEDAEDDDDEDVVTHLADDDLSSEMPMSKKEEKTPASKPVAKTSGDDDASEIDDLLSQLDDDD